MQKFAVGPKPNGRAEPPIQYIALDDSNPCSLQPNIIIAVPEAWESYSFQKKIDRSRMKAPIQSSAIGINGLTFKLSWDSSVAIAPA